MERTPYLTTAEAALKLRRPESTLRYWRYKGYGPPFVKMGRLAVYFEADIDAWISSLRGDQPEDLIPVGPETAA